MSISRIQQTIAPFGWTFRAMTGEEMREREKVGAFSTHILEKEGHQPIRYNFPPDGGSVFHECCNLVIDDVMTIEAKKKLETK